ncbi:MAG: hypothetical protein DRO67_03470 [Candidatus Asgardarchaeum californiense]|nr:MAG: hypothetical protein DRO67_03470 [Candidatus Asgardarchaeum californiense]
MERRSLNYKYWVEFDEDGEIKALHSNKYDCKSPCKEYIVKLIPIKRDVEKELTDSIEKFSDTLIKKSKVLDTEFKKTIKTVKGVLK